MKITADTNVLLRVVLNDDEAQQQVAIDTLESAEAVAVSVQALCEFVRVLDRGYKTAYADIAAAIRSLLEMRNVVVNRPAVEAGLRVLDAGGDFADGIIAFDGNWLGGETFVSFDRKAVAILARRGQQARLLSPHA
ncbi:MAG TPA: type II toxin-antitoxin system VapC family toxin [Acetobacteraceae bacterium]